MRWIVCGILAVILASASGCLTGGDPAADRFGNEPALGRAANEDDSWKEWDESGPERMRTSVSSYVHNRWLDFLDMFEVGMSIGTWVRVEAQYGFGFFGYGITDYDRWRFGQRSVVLQEENTMFSTLPFPASLLLYPLTLGADEVTGDIVMLGGISYDNEHHIWPEPVWSGVPSDPKRVRMAFMSRDIDSHQFMITGDSFAIGAEAHMLLGAKARVLPLEIFDFLAGILALDPLGDTAKPYDPAQDTYEW